MKLKYRHVYTLFMSAKTSMVLVIFLRCSNDKIFLGFVPPAAVNIIILTKHTDSSLSCQL